MTTRRLLLSVISAACLSAPLAAVAQTPSKTFRIGILAPRRRPDPLDADFLGQVPAGLRELGYVDGKNIRIEWRFADGDYTRLPALAAELVRLPVDVIVTESTPSTVAARKATQTIPIVFTNVADPAGSGFIASLAHPGGNTTGVSNFASDTTVKELEILRAVAPGQTIVAALWNPANQSGPLVLENLRKAAEPASITIRTFESRTPEEISDAFGRMAKEHLRALLIVPDQLFLQQARQVSQRAVELRMPSIASVKEFAEAGGLMSYGSDRFESCHRAASYVGKILTGANPADLPVEQPTRFELVINRKTARALGLEIPPELLLMADKVIE